MGRMDQSGTLILVYKVELVYPGLLRFQCRIEISPVCHLEYYRYYYYHHSYTHTRMYLCALDYIFARICPILQIGSSTELN